MASKTSKQTPNNLIIQNTVISQVVRNQIDITKWQNALKSAENINNPNRTSLYDIYSGIILDGHLESVMAKRKAAILSKKFVFMRNGEADPVVNQHLKSPWFFRFMNDLLDTPWWGHSVFQFYHEGEWIKYDLIPRKHVKPERKLFVKGQNDTTGESYINNPAYPNVLEVSWLKPLGLLNIACPYVVYKRNGFGDFAQFAEIFGQPLREGIYDANDEEARKKLNEDLNNVGSSAVFIHPRGTELNIKDSPFKASSTGIYDKLVELCNAELSKLALGNTLTTQQGENGARSLGEVHKEGEELINVTDLQWVSNVLNYDMADIFAALGINVTGGEFTIQEKENTDLTARVLIDMQIASKVPIDDDYWYETYGISKPKDFEAAKAAFETSKQATIQTAPQKGSSKSEPTATNKHNAFFDVYEENDTFLNKVFSFFDSPRRR
jgi:phage gp29-like protein